MWFLVRNIGTIVSSGITGNNCGQGRPPALAIARALCSPSGVAVAIPSERFSAMCGQWHKFVLHGAVRPELAMRIHRPGSVACICQEHEAGAMCHQPNRVMCSIRAPAAIMILRVGLNRRPGCRRLRGSLSYQLRYTHHGLSHADMVDMHCG